MNENPEDGENEETEEKEKSTEELKEKEKSTEDLKKKEKSTEEKEDKEKSADTVILSWSDYLLKNKHECVSRVNEGVSDLKKEDFKFLEFLSSGSFSEIYKVKFRRDKKIYVLKKVPRQFQKYADSEKFLLNCINFRFLIYMKYHFQDDEDICFVLPFIEGGDLFTLLRKRVRFNEKLSKFYTGQILLALEYLHNLNIIYRDLKPENILLERNGYIRITDFGLSKLTDSRAYTICGTTEYLAPEMLLYKGYGNTIDFWAFGVLIYEFNAGVSPFFSAKEEHVMEKIINGTYEEKEHFSDELKDIIKQLLNPDISKRYGSLANGTNDIKEHNWYLSLSWLLLANKALRPPYVPTKQ